MEYGTALIFLLLGIALLFVLNRRTHTQLYAQPITEYPCIFQTVGHKDKISTKLQNNMRRLRDMNPTWKYRLFDDREIDEYVSTNWADTREAAAFFAINRAYGPARADLWRYMIIYEFGGFYADAKTFCEIPLDELLVNAESDVPEPEDTPERIHDYKLPLLWYWDRIWTPPLIGNVLGEIAQFYLFYTPKHPLLLAVIDAVVDKIENYDAAVHGIGKHGVLGVTGPYVFTNAIEAYLEKYPTTRHTFLPDHGSGLLYSSFDVGKMEHENMFGQTHYSDLTSPIVFNEKFQG